MTRIHLPSTEDIAILRELVREYRHRRKGQVNLRPDDIQAYLTPEVYVVKVPEGGIPPIEKAEVGTSDIVTAVLCNVFTLTTTDPALPHNANLQVEVHNFSEESIPEGWALALRDKYGRWIGVRMTGPFAGILFTLVTPFDYTGTDTGVASATVTINEWWGRDPSEDDPIKVFDEQMLFPAAKTGAKGIAIWDQDHERYIVVECQSKAGWIIAVVHGEQLGTSDYVSVDSILEYGGTQQDIQEPDLEGLQFTDPLDKIPTVDEEEECDVGTGSSETGPVTYKVVALLDSATGEYHIISAQRTPDSPTLRKIPGLKLDELPVETNPAYALGINENGCLVRIGLTDECES